MVGMSIEDVARLWEEEWIKSADIHEHSSIIGKFLRVQRMGIIRKMLKSISKELSAIDVGCGSGETLLLLRDIGFKNSIGIDISSHAMRKSELHGLTENVDVFRKDGSNTGYPDRKFDFMFSDGLWEHFKDPLPFIKEGCRISDKWLMIVQPNHFSFFGGLLNWGWEHFSQQGVHEYSFPMSYFIDNVTRNGFTIIDRRGTYLNEQNVLFFRRD